MPNSSAALDTQPDPQFCKEDYKLKVDFLTGQFQRMWVRFNLFLTLETGLVALLFVKDIGALTRFALPVATVEAIISFIWFFIGLQDRCLVLVYREHIRQAASSLAALHITSSGYRHVGEVKDTRKELMGQPEGLLTRLELGAYFHVTRLAYLFPGVALVLWFGVAIFALATTPR